MAELLNLKKRQIVANRVFLAYQWHIYRPIFEQVCESLHRTFPVYFYAVGRPSGQPAEALMEKIKSIILSSTAAIFDASRGNPNVSLEYGLAHFVPDLPTYLLIDQHTMPNQVNVGTPIISDLAGSTQNRWTFGESETLIAHLKAIADNHPYTKRFRRYCKNRGLTRGQFRTPLRVIRLFDERESILRREVMDQLSAEWRSRPQNEIERLLTDMHKAGLITISPGREWASRISIA